jgi:hypothetical protein
MMKIAWKELCPGVIIDHVCLGQVGIVKRIGAETMKVWLDFNLSNLQAYVLTFVSKLFVLHLHLVLRHT